MLCTTPPQYAKNQRVTYLDALKCFAIFLVILGHTVQYLLSSNHTDEPLYRFIYNFHMPLFMCISGFFAYKMLNRTIWQVISRRFMQLIIPSITFSIFIWLLCTSIWDEEFSLAHYLEGSFWFLKSAFCCSILYYLTIRYIPNKGIAFASGLIISQLISQYQLQIMYPAFLFGSIICSEWKRIEKYSLITASVSLIIFIIGIILNELQFSGHYLTSSTIAVSSLKRLFRIMTGLSGALFFILQFHLISAYMANTKFWSIASEWGKYTLGVYLVQTIILEKVLPHFENCDALNPWLFNLLFAPLLSFLLLYICILIVRLMSQFSFVRKIALGA